MDIPYECDGQTYYARVTTCYYCYITANEVCYYIKKIIVPNGNPACHQNMKNAISEFLMHYTYKYCGFEPCGFNDPLRITFAEPMCAKMIYKSNSPRSYTIKFDDECFKLCIRQGGLCYCLCDASCNEPPCPQPHLQYFPLADPTGIPPFANCNIVPIYWMPDPKDPEGTFFNLNANYDWETCLLIKTHCLDEGFDGALQSNVP